MSSSFSSPADVCPRVAAFAPYEAGLSIDGIRRRYGLERVIKLASNENPLGLSPMVEECLRRNAALAFRYPQSGNPDLVTALAAHHHVPESDIFLGNGSDEIIDLLFRVRCEPGLHNAVAHAPCFSIYDTQARLCGVELRQAPLNPDFSFNYAGLLEKIDQNTSLVFLTTPDNPSGFCPRPEEVAAFALALPPGCLLVLDEAYIQFSGDEAAWSLLGRRGEFSNLAFIRTFSKLYGLAGLRVGYAVLPAFLAQCLWRVRLPFSLNILAEKAALAALEDTVFTAETLRVTSEGRVQLRLGLEALGWQVWPSLANFLLTRPPFAAKAAHQALLERGFILRTLGGYNLPDHLRISVGTAEENQLLLAACGELAGVLA